MISDLVLITKGLRDAFNIKFNFHNVEVDDRYSTCRKYLLVHISDLHVTNNPKYINPQKLKEIVNDLNEKLEEIQAKPETTIVVFTGDMVNREIDGRHETDLDSIKEAKDILKSINAEYKFAVTGNHDIEHSKTEIIEKTLSEAGFVVFGKNLYNYENQKLPFNVIGLPDYTLEPEFYSEHKPELERYLKDDQPTLLLSHNASVFDLVGYENWFADKSIGPLYGFSGHTHGMHFAREEGIVGMLAIGQVILGWIAQKFIKYSSKYTGGFYKLPNGFISVTTGVGIHPAVKPIRTGNAAAGIEIFAFV